MNPDLPASLPEVDLCIGERIREFRLAKGYSLAALARRVGLSEATLSRIENGQTLISAHSLYVLSTVLEVDITAFYERAANPIRSGIRSISRNGEGRHIETARFAASVLGADLANKKMHPSIDVISHRTLEEVGGLAAHAGEEFLYVVEGRLVFHSEHYAPLLLNAGDSVYFDGTMAHAYLTPDPEPARILVINSTETNVPLSEVLEETV
jgi:transcriptional regulator with XRE-family HTH domain